MIFVPTIETEYNILCGPSTFLVQSINITIPNYTIIYHTIVYTTLLYTIWMPRTYACHSQLFQLITFFAKKNWLKGSHHFRFAKHYPRHTCEIYSKQCDDDDDDDDDDDVNDDDDQSDDDDDDDDDDES